jgi:hypothetical protein
VNWSAIGEAAQLFSVVVLAFNQILAYRDRQHLRRYIERLERKVDGKS